MDLFTKIKKFFIALGISEMNHVHGHQYRWILIVLALCNLFYATSTSMWYFSVVAETLNEHIAALTFPDAILFLSTFFLIFLGHRTTLLRLIQQIQFLVEKRTCIRWQIKALLQFKCCEKMGLFIA